MAVNGVYIVQGELNALVASLRRSASQNKWQTASSLEQDVLLRSFVDLREVLTTVPDLSDMAPNTFLAPFLEVIRSEHTNGIVTGQALAAVGKFLSYGLINPNSLTAPGAVRSIADSVNGTRFVGTDAGSDEVVLFRILQVLRALLLTSVGVLVSDESVCVLLQSCFRICFEKRLSELLRRSAECCLMDMIQLLFTRLPSFVEDPHHPYVRRLKMRAEKRDANLAVVEKTLEQRIEQAAEDVVEDVAIKATQSTQEVADDTHTDKSTPEIVGGQEPDIDDSQKESAMPEQDVSEKSQQQMTPDVHEIINDRGVRFKSNDDEDDDGNSDDDSESQTVSIGKKSFGDADDETPSVVAAQNGPYGLPCIRELLRFLISISTPEERQNSDDMLELGLNLLVVAMEAAADHIGRYAILLPLIKNELCKNLTLALLSPKPSTFAVTLRLGFLVFEALRTHLKFQLEAYLCRLKELVLAEHALVPGQVAANVRHPMNNQQLAQLIERRELALEALVQLWCIPGLVTELYLNYDCDLYCSNLFEELTKLLSKNSFPIGQELGSAHVLSLDALLTVIDSIEVNCHYRMLNYDGDRQQKMLKSSSDDRNAVSVSPSHMLPMASGISAGKMQTAQSPVPTLHHGAEAPAPKDTEVMEVLKLPQMRPNRMPISADLIFSHEDLIARKQKKRLLQTGTDLFNQTPAKGILFLQEHGLFRTPMQPEEVVEWLKENPHLDKRKIAEYIVNRKNTKTLEAFVKSFDFRQQRLDQALRQFLETFRLPGEAAEISMVMEHFAQHWFDSNNRPFLSVDAAFTLAYAVIMLNVDQHNPLAKRQNQPMTTESFKKNVSGIDGGQNLNQTMLDEIFKAVSTNEIIMPAEQTGTVRENYLWKLLLKRGLRAPEGRFIHAPSGLYDHDLFQLVWGPTVAALSYVFDKTQDEGVITKASGGFRKCAAVAAHYVMSDVFDNLMINLCKFSQILNNPDNPVQLIADLAENAKAQCAAKVMFQLVRNHGDILREGWRNVCDCLVQLFKADLLTDSFVQVEDFSNSEGLVSISRNFRLKKSKADSGGGSIFSSFYNYLGGSGPSSSSTQHQPDSDGVWPQDKLVREMIRDQCKPDQLVAESKYLTAEALHEFLKALVVGGAQAASGMAPMSPSGPTTRDMVNVERRQSVLPHQINMVLAEEAEATIVFYLELLISVCLENRDRMMPYWRTVRCHIFSLIADYGSDEHCLENSRRLIERCVVALLRLATRLLARSQQQQPLCDELVDSLAALPSTLRRSTFASFARQIVGGLAVLLQSRCDSERTVPRFWTAVVELLEAAGACVFPMAASLVPSGPKMPLENLTQRRIDKRATVARSDNDESRHASDQESLDRGYTSDTELYSPPSAAGTLPTGGASSLASSGEWLYVVGGHEQQPAKPRSRPRVLDPQVFASCCQTLAGVVRDSATNDRVAEHNFEAIVRCLHTFVEASIDTSMLRTSATSSSGGAKSGASRQKSRGDRSTSQGQKTRAGNTTDADNVHELLEQNALLLVDISFHLHSKASVAFGLDGANQVESIEKASAIWLTCWRPLLQILSHQCCDQRRRVRLLALTSLQRALLMPELRLLTCFEWQDCCYNVLFPLLTQLLNEKQTVRVTGDAQGRKSPIRNKPELMQTDSMGCGLDEARVRAVTLTSKVFLQHLALLAAGNAFLDLWLTILDFMQRYLVLDSSDLNESVPESVKNMLLVLGTAQLFRNNHQLAESTRIKLSNFLPDLTEMLVHQEEPVKNLAMPPPEGHDSFSSEVPPESAPPASLEENAPNYEAPTASVLSQLYNTSLAFQTLRLLPPAAGPCEENQEYRSNFVENPQVTPAESEISIPLEEVIVDRSLSPPPIRQVRLAAPPGPPITAQPEGRIGQSNQSIVARTDRTISGVQSGAEGSSITLGLPEYFQAKNVPHQTDL